MSGSPDDKTEARSTRTPATELAYLQRGEQIVRRFETETGLNWLDNHDRFREWADDFARTLYPATRRQYRAAMRQYYRINAPGYLAPRFQVAATRREVARQHGRRTSSSKRKYLDHQVLPQVLHRLGDSNSQYAYLAAALLVAGEAFGPRPSEWQHAELLETEDGVRLRIRNAKNSNGRTFGDYRTLHVKDVSAEAIEAAKHLVNTFPLLAGTTSEGASAVVRFAGRELRNALRALGKRGAMTLYSARHQFAADAKATGHSLAEIAAMMGHASTDTARQSYGRRFRGRRGRGPFRVAPDAADVQAVEQINQDRAAPKHTPEWLKHF